MPGSTSDVVCWQAPTDNGIGCPACYQPLSVDMRPAVQVQEAPAADVKPAAVAVTFGKSSILHDVDLSSFQSSSKVCYL